jgi:hypothetical protein
VSTETGERLAHHFTPRSYLQRRSVYEVGGRRPTQGDAGAGRELEITEDLAALHETVEKGREGVFDSEISQPEFRRTLVAQCSILVAIAGIVAWLIAG